MNTFPFHQEKYPGTFEYWKFLSLNYDKVLKRNPEIMSLDWNDEVIIKYYFTLIEIIPFGCIFSVSAVQAKIESSKWLNEINEKWMFSLEKIEESADKLVNKHQEFIGDNLLFSSISYTNLKITVLLKDIHAGLVSGKSTRFNSKIFLENSRKRRKETPKEILEKYNIVLGINKSMYLQTSFDIQNFFTENGVCSENIENQKSLSNRVVDVVTSGMERELNSIFDEKKTKSLMRSIFVSQDGREIIRLIPIMTLTKYPKREVYRDFFNYLITFMKETEGLLNEDEYEDYEKDVNAQFSYDNYKDYKENKVKIIFGLTK